MCMYYLLVGCLCNGYCTTCVRADTSLTVSQIIHPSHSFLILSAAPGPLSRIMDGDAEATLGEEQGKSTYKPKTKLDHLGQPITKGATQRYRYARTYTVIYDGAGGMDAGTEKTWRLLLDTGRAISLRTDSLQKLFRILQNAAPTREHALIGPKAFKLAMQQFGLNDPILVSRLFGEFKEGASTMMGARIDFRQFVRVLCTMSKEAIVDR